MLFVLLNRKPFLLILSCALCYGSGAQNLSAASLPDSLRKNAVAVTRVDETVMEIESPRKAHVHYLYIYTILNSMGDQYADFHVLYNKFHKLNSASATLYDGSGKELQKVKKNDMEDRSDESPGTLVTDTRIKCHHFTCHNYPYTVRYEEDVDMDGIFFLPQWRPQPVTNIAVESARMIVKTPASYPLRYKLYHYPGKETITENKGEKIYTWELDNRPARQIESYAPQWYQKDPCVQLVPGEFEIEGYKGSMNTWADMARFITALWTGRDQLPEEAKKKVHALTDGLGSQREKINALYGFLQQNSHYVSIQLGIGGWQPFDAAYVYSKRYGDCKALANYMVALLKEAGVSSNYVLIRAGAGVRGFDTSFVCNQFNHVIVLARAGADSVWLECTSQTLEPGYLGSFTADRNGLLIDGNGGYLVHTPIYGVNDNQVLRTLRGSIDSSGTLRAGMQTLYSGMEQDGLHDMITRMTKQEQAGRVQQILALTNSTITGITYRSTGTGIPAIEETLQLSVDNFATVSGRRLFISPGAFLKKVSSIRDSREARKDNIELTYSGREVDSVVLQIPPGYSIESDLPSRTFSAAFGSYNFRCTLEGETLTFTCIFQQKKGEYPAALFPRLESFYNLISKEDGYQLVLVKK